MQERCLKLGVPHCTPRNGSHAETTKKFRAQDQPRKDRRSAAATQALNIELKEKEDKAVKAIESLRQRHNDCKSEVTARKP